MYRRAGPRYSSVAVDLRFEKYEGLGNDFLIVEDGREHVVAGVPERLCDRHRGVGADGVLLTGLEAGRPFMRVRNADGSAPEMCGNGVRCVARYLHARGLVGDEFELDTDAGPHLVSVLEDGRVRVGMRPASLDPKHLPLASDHRWIDEAIELAGETIRVTAVSMGNPHAVTFDPQDIQRNGPLLERHPAFPQRVNAGFAVVRDDVGEIHLSVFERGVGWTQACGTGACAAAVAAVETGRAMRGDDIRVRLEGGVLLVRVDAPNERVWMTGPARRVFSGTVPV